MRVTIMASVFLLAAAGFAHADCQSDTDAALDAVQKVVAEAPNLGTCDAAKQLQAAYSAAADVMGKCNSKDSFGNDASTYSKGAKDAEAGVAAACK